MARKYRITVYYATNKDNGKTYIGQSKYGLAVSKARHKRKSLILNKKSPFYEEIRQIGFDAFEWGILKECSSKEEAEIFERKHIENIGLKNCYNTHIGGKKGFDLNDETKAILSRQKLGNKNPMYGKDLTKKEKDNLLAASMEVCSKKVVRVSDGQVYPSISECARQNNMSIGAVSLHVNGKIKSQRFEFVKYGSV